MNPFDLRLLRHLPRPSLSFIFATALSTLFAACYISHIISPYSPYNLYYIGNGMQAFLYEQNRDNGPAPEILVAGSSRNGMAVHMSELEKRTKMTSGKITFDGGTPLDFLNATKIYTEECRNARLVIIDAFADHCGVWHVEGNGQRGPNMKRREIMTSLCDKASVRSFSDTWKKWGVYAFRQNFWDLLKYIKDSEYDSKNEKVVRLHHLGWDKEEEIRVLMTEERQAINQKVIRTRELSPIFLEEEKRAIEELLEQNFVVVLNITPFWSGLMDFTQDDLENPGEDEYLRLLSKWNRHPNCLVVICRDFKEITSEGKDEDYLFDYGHMTREGAILYTNWLVDRMLESPKTATILKGNSTRQRQ